MGLHQEVEVFLNSRNMWFLVSADPILDSAGNVIGVVHALKDITERKGMGEQLRAKLEEIEEETLNHPSAETLERIHRLKRNLILLRKAVWPVREIAGFLERCGSDLIQKQTGI